MKRMAGNDRKNAGVEGLEGRAHPELNRELDRILSADDPLLPSSGFAASVMQEIERRAAEPGPIPFPWKLAIPGFVAILAGFGVLVWLAVTTFQSWRTGGEGDFLPQIHFGPIAELAMRSSLGAAAIALAGAWLCVLLARKMAGAGSSSR
jgi:hypothetical protein